MKKPLAILIALSCTFALAAPIGPEQALSAPTVEVERALPESHPAVTYAYAKRLFEQGRRDNAVMWFYVGQLRFRFHLRANPSLPRDGEPALMASLNSTIGQTINEWAGGSPKSWAASIEQALAWDLAHENSITSKQVHSQALEDTRTGLASLRESILSSEENIRTQRRERGLENR